MQNLDLKFLDEIDKFITEGERLTERPQYENSLEKFVSYVWPAIEPSRSFQTGWVVQAICEHLEAVTKGQLRRLLINVPPGFTKSTLVGVMWPAWEWGPRNMPSNRYICASYAEHLSVRDNMRCKNVVLSSYYQRLWSDRFEIAPDLMSKIKFGNTKTGWKLATSVTGVGVGERADRFIIDDPHNTMEMESETSRNTTKMWFTEVVPDRLNNQQESAIVIIMQRLHEEDVSGIAIARDMGYEHLMIPMRYEGPERHCSTSIGWTDKRKEDGELAWPERFPENICFELERDKGPYAWASQYQQSPEPRGGSIIKRDYWRPWTEHHFPQCEYILASLDTAYTTKESNDPSALTIWGVFREDQDVDTMLRDYGARSIHPYAPPPVQGNVKVCLLYAWRQRLEFNDLVQAVINTCTKDRRVVGGYRFAVDRIIIEAKASGISIAQELRRLCSVNGQFGVELIKLKGNQDKVARLHSVQHLFAEGMVYAPIYPDSDRWRDYAGMVIDELSIFPHGAHDDLVDSTSMAMRYLRDNGFMVRVEEKKLADEEEMLYRGGVAPLYPC